MSHHYASSNPLTHVEQHTLGQSGGPRRYWRPTSFNPEGRVGGGFNVLPDVYFSGSENVTEFLDGIDNLLKLLEIPRDLACAYLKSHLQGRASDWYQIFGYTSVQNTATDYEHLKAALTKAFPPIRNKKDLESKFYASQQRRDQEPTEFMYDLLKIHKQLDLKMPEETLVDHILVRLEPQVQDYVEVRNPQSTVQLLEVLSKFEERYSCKTMRDSRNNDRVEGRGWNVRRTSGAENGRRNWRNSDDFRRQGGSNDYRGNYVSGRQRNQWFDSRNSFQRDDRRFNNGRGQNENFSRGDRRSRGSSDNFDRGNRRQSGRLNNLKVRENDQKDQVESVTEEKFKVSAICMSPVDLPNVPILLNEIFTKALWDTGAEKSFVSEEMYRKYFFYKQIQKSRAQVITAQGAKCQNVGIVELNVRIREFEKLWKFHVLADLEYQCILGVDFISASQIVLDFERKSLAIPDSQISKVVDPVEEEAVEIDLSKTKLEDGQKKELCDLFQDFKGLFSDKPGLTHVLYHEIDTGDKPPVVSRPYRYDRVKQKIIDFHIEKMLREGTIIPIQSPYASPVVLCRKNNGLPPDNPEAYRFAIDYRKLNAITKYPRYPLPLIDDLVTNIPHTAIMSSLDLRSGYFQLAIDPKDVVKTAFVTKNGTYAFRRMPFGLSGAAPNFQKAIDIILKPVIGRFVNVYMDDVIIASPSFSSHVEHLREVFRLLQEAGLTLNKEKCKFACEELKYLGLIISKEGIKTDETKVKAIVDMKPPRNSKEVSKFLGMSQWYAKFIKNYADLCEPLYCLKRKLKKFVWSSEAQKAFEAVKVAITNAPVLQLPDFQKPFELFTDASSIGIGAVLNQQQRPVVFASRTLSSAERNYTVTERECLAVVWALNKFRTYLGSLPIKVITDHAALTRLTNGKNLSSRMIRWVLKLAEFNIEWEHRPGTQNVVADVLSRNPVESVLGEKVNCAIIHDLVLSSRNQLIEEQKKDPELGHIYRYLANPDDKSLDAAICENWSRDFRLIEGLLFYAKYATTLGEMRVYIPQSLRAEVLREFHDKPIAGHLGRYKTYCKLRDVCYFPYMSKVISQYVSTCHVCQTNNYKNALPAGRLNPIVSNYPNEIVTLDLLGPYPASRVKRNRYVLVITDHFSKWCEVIPIKKASSRVIADTFFDNYISRYGAPIKLISDNGPQFISDIFENLSTRLDIRHVKTVVYRPQANRTERVNRDLVQMIANYVSDKHDNWDQFLREFAYAIRTAVNETTGKTPAELFLGRKLITPFQKLVMVSDGSEFAVGDIEKSFNEARTKMKEKHKKWAKYYDKRRRDVQIRVNDWVLVQTHHLSSATKKIVAKFMPKYEGPYRVVEVKGNNLVIRKAGKNVTVNVDQVRTYHHRKNEELGIRTDGLNGNSSRSESRIVGGRNTRSKVPQSNGQKESGVGRELEDRGLSRNLSQMEKQKLSQGPQIRSIPSSWSSGTRQIKKQRTENLNCKRSLQSGSGGPARKQRKGVEQRGEKRTVPSYCETNYLFKKHRWDDATTGRMHYFLRPRKGPGTTETRPSTAKTTRGGRTAQARSRSRQCYRPYPTDNSSSTTRRKGRRQQQRQPREGAKGRKSVSLEVLVGDVKYKS